ncbi:hypothetical protein [Foetidibacter luteolus]|uniref:hypothetical protein n=1 Tax=Foetidibacter luteolus TaxID=2608880 RepID=UPI00129B5984|nr:hypothetical protein [Foetidibacter luteolus]
MYPDLHYRSIRKISIPGSITAPQISWAKLTLQLNAGKDPAALLIQFRSAKTIEEFGGEPDPFIQWLSLNVENIKLGLIHPDELLLFQIRFYGNFQYDPDNRIFIYELPIDGINVPVTEPINIFQQEQVSLRGLSLWFIGLTGLVNISEQLVIATEVINE